MAGNWRSVDLLGETLGTVGKAVSEYIKAKKQENETNNSWNRLYSSTSIFPGKDSKKYGEQLSDPDAGTNSLRDSQLLDMAKGLGMSPMDAFKVLQVQQDSRKPKFTKVGTPGTGMTQYKVDPSGRLSNPESLIPAPAKEKRLPTDMDEIRMIATGMPEHPLYDAAKAAYNAYLGEREKENRSRSTGGGAAATREAARQKEIYSLHMERWKLGGEMKKLDEMMKVDPLKYTPDVVRAEKAQLQQQIIEMAKRIIDLGGSVNAGGQSGGQANPGVIDPSKPYSVSFPTQTTSKGSKYTILK